MNNLENTALSTIVNIEPKEIDDIINEFVNNLYSIYKNKVPTIISFRLFDTSFDYYVENQLLKTKISNSNIEIAKGENGLKIIEDINSVTKDLNKSDAITKLIEYQKEKQIACKVYRKMKNKFLPKYKRKGLHRKKK